MRKDSKATRTRGWLYSGFIRNLPDQPFQPLEIADPFMRCVACHSEVRASDFVFTPYTNRADPAPARVPGTANRVEIFNNQFGPRELHAKAGTTVAWANYDAVPHDVKAADRSFESGNLPTQGRYFLTVTKPGTVAYFCAVHLEMRGWLIVTP